ncbi:hypothetical protein 12VC501_gene0085 [Vibrio phage 12VC501]|nr:hypothetical protein 12VC501_gene0085 [Vibrio phage 12VC501]
MKLLKILGIILGSLLIGIIVVSVLPFLFAISIGLLVIGSAYTIYKIDSPEISELVEKMKQERESN